TGGPSAGAGAPGVASSGLPPPATPEREAAGVLDRLAGLAHRRARRIVIGAVLLAVIAGAVGGSVATRLGPYSAKDPASESVKAENRLRAATGLDNDRLVALVHTSAPIGSPSGRARVADRKSTRLN